MEELYLAENRPFSVRFRSLKVLLAVLLVCVVALTGGTNKAINTVFFGTSLLLSLIDYRTFGYTFYAGSIVYFGYSYIELNNYFPGNFGSAGYTYLLSAAVIAGRLIRVKKSGELASICKKLGILFFAFAAVYSISRLSTSAVTAAGAFLSVLVTGLLIVEFQNRTRDFETFLHSLIVFLFSTYIYVIVWRELLSAELASGYPGARDGNNFSYLCNIAIVLLQYSRLRFKKLLTVLLSISTLITISISGFVTLAAIFVVFKVCNTERRQAVKWVFVLLLVTMMVLAFGNLLLPRLASMDGTIGSLALRVQKIMNALSEGDYQAATTSRTMLWDYYIIKYDAFSLGQKLFGSYGDLLKIQTTYYASHNVFLDLLMGSGVLGLLLFILLYLKSIGEKLRQRENQRVLLSMVFLINLFFRTFSGFSMLFPILF